jgi:DNA-binding Lrp family transcriptional regulator
MKNHDERTLLDLLRRKAPQTFDDLIALSGLSPAQVLLAVDRLTRSRAVVLRRVGPEYWVSPEEAGIR